MDVDDYHDPIHGVTAHGDEAILIARERILSVKGELVLEDPDCIGKVDSMLGQVRLGLGDVPFVAQSATSSVYGRPCTRASPHSFFRRKSTARTDRT